MTRPSKLDPSKPKAEGYDYKKKFYQSEEVAEDYDRHRFTTPERQKRNWREWRATQRALALAEGTELVLDLPCGTGRFTGHLARAGYGVIGSDISRPMMKQARSKPELGLESILGYVQADAERLPYADGAVDCVMSIRFMFHVDPQTRRRILREMGRVSRRWLVIDYRHRYSARWVIWRLASALRLTRKPFERVSRKSMAGEFSDAGLSIAAVIPTRRGLSDKWIVLAESPAGERSRAVEAIAASEFSDLELGERIGEGRRSSVFAGTWNGRDVAVKFYKQTAIDRHRRKLGVEIARFEYERNRELFRIPTVSRYVTEPLGYFVGERTQFAVQERLRGPLYYVHCSVPGNERPPRFERHLEILVAGAHAAGIYDLDLHAMNVMVQREPDGAWIPRLFDFNMIPVTMSARNPFESLALRLGLRRPEARDLSRLAGFDDFRRVERKHVGRYAAPPEVRIDT